MPKPQDRVAPEHVVVLGANGTMGYGSAALFTQAVPKVTFLARSKEKAQAGLDAAVAQVRSATVALRAAVGDYDDLETVLGDADFVFEALAEDRAVKAEMYDRVDALRRPDAVVASVTSGISINELAAGRSESFRRHFLGLHFFNPPNVIVGTELIPGDDTDPAVADRVEEFARRDLGREVVRTADTPAFVGNRVGFKVLNECAQLAEQLGPVMVDRLVGPYTGRSMTPLATIDLVGFDVHRAIVDNVFELTADEAHESFRLPAYMDALMERGVLGRKSGGGFFATGEDRTPLALDPGTGAYRPVASFAVPPLPYIDEVAALYAQGRYADGMAVFLAAGGEHADVARNVVAGYLSYAFHRAGEVTETIDGIDRIMGAGFGWAPPSVLVDAMGPAAAVALIDRAGLPVPDQLVELARAPRRLFTHPTMNAGRFFVAA
jgi:3-hydroxyacyl-CoA dehydrogenase